MLSWSKLSSDFDTRDVCAVNTLASRIASASCQIHSASMPAGLLLGHGRGVEGREGHVGEDSVAAGAEMGFVRVEEVGAGEGGLVE
jgi:hypothetical protein